MASTNAHQIKNNDQNSLCGLGDKIRRLTAGVCLFTQIFFPVMATAQNVVHAKPQTTVSSAPPLIENNTVPYTLGALESAQSVADRFGISLGSFVVLISSVLLLAALITCARVRNWMFRQQPRRKAMSNKMPYRLRMAKTRWRIK